MVIRKPTTHIYKDVSVACPRLPQPTRLIPQKLEEEREKGLCYSFDSKYSKGHKCAEKKLFYIYCEEEEENEQEEDIHQEPTLEEEEMNPTISCNALAGITTPQTLNIEGKIKLVVPIWDLGENLYVYLFYVLCSCYCLFYVIRFVCR